MAHIFKKFNPQNQEKGILTITQNEFPAFDDFPADLREQYFIGINYTSAQWVKNAVKQPYQDFCMGSKSLVNFSGETPFRIPLTHSSFTQDYFCKNESVIQFWDIINVSRNHKIKCLRSFLFAIRKLYDAGYKYRVLLVVPSCPSESEDTHYIELVKVYGELFSRQERCLFTLMRLSPELGFLGISPETIAHFYQSSKVATLFSLSEGEPRAINEALLCGLPIVCYSGQKGAGLDHLNSTNAILFDDYEKSWEALRDAVENVGKGLVVDTEYMANTYSETRTISKLESYFKTLYELHGQLYTGGLINLDEMSLRLPAHFKEVPWFVQGDVTSTIASEQQKEVFYDELRKY